MKTYFYIDFFKLLANTAFNCMSTDRAVKLRVEGAKTPAPPLQLTPLGVQGH